MNVVVLTFNAPYRIMVYCINLEACEVKMRGLYVLAIALIISCSQNPYSDDGASDNPNGDDGTSDPAKLSLSFTSTGLSRNLSRDAGQVDANEIIHIKLGMTTNRDPSALDPVLSRKPLALGVNQLELDKDDVHLIAFVNNPEAAARREGGPSYLFRHYNHRKPQYRDIRPRLFTGRRRGGAGA